MGRLARAIGACLLSGLLACGSGQPAPATAPPPPPAASRSGGAAGPAARPPLFVEYVVIKRAWVEKLVPIDVSADEAAERAYRHGKAPELTTKLADDLAKRLASGAPARRSIAEAVEAVLGERAVSDAYRPTAVIVDRDKLREARLPAAAKAGLERFADGAQPGETMPAPAVDADVVVVARAVRSQEAE